MGVQVQDSHIESTNHDYRQNKDGEGRTEGASTESPEAGNKKAGTLDRDLSRWSIRSASDEH